MILDYKQADTDKDDINHRNKNQIVTGTSDVILSKKQPNGPYGQHIEIENNALSECSVIGDLCITRIFTSEAQRQIYSTGNNTGEK